MQSIVTYLSTFIIASLILATPFPPDRFIPHHLDVVTVNIDKVVDTSRGMLLLTYKEEAALVTVRQCSIAWNRSDEFYLIADQKFGAVLAPVREMDEAWALYGHDFGAAVESLRVKNRICLVIDMEVIR